MYCVDVVWVVVSMNVVSIVYKLVYSVIWFYIGDSCSDRDVEFFSLFCVSFNGNLFEVG